MTTGTSTTPMLTQIRAIKKQYPGYIVIFKAGSFFEVIDDDALFVAEHLGMKLMNKKNGLNQTGRPVVDYKKILLKPLLQLGRKIVIVDQVERPSQAKGKILKREVVKVITPGSIISEELLDDNNNFLSSLAYYRNSAGLSFIDISTGDVYCTELSKQDVYASIKEIVKYRPSEMLVTENVEEGIFTKLEKEIKNNYGLSKQKMLSLEDATNSLKKHFKVKSLADFKIQEKYALIISLASAISYLKSLQKSELNNITDLVYYVPDDKMILEPTTIQNLHLFENKHSLFNVLNATLTPMGGRKLTDWIKQPLNRKQISQIVSRLSLVEELLQNFYVCENIRSKLRGTADIPRITSRLANNFISPLAFNPLKYALETYREVKQILTSSNLKFWEANLANSPESEDIINLIETYILSKPTTKNSYINPACYGQLLELASMDHHAWTKEFEERQKKETGIDKLLIDVSDKYEFCIKIPMAIAKPRREELLKKYTIIRELKNGIRFTNPELLEYEKKFKTRLEEQIILEEKVFKEFCEKMQNHLKDIVEISKILSYIDVLQSFAYVSRKYNYIKPEINLSTELVIQEGRHPLVERVQDEFIPNDIEFNSEANMFLITGPNMAGKSVFIRQVALITLMAQIGCFVPANYCKLGIVDQIFTRIGATDNILEGQSTFMVEMAELSYILKNATEYSLILLDEVGRGTESSDGFCLAWSMSEYIKKYINCKTIFATHFILLHNIVNYIQGIKNISFLVEKERNNLVFHHKVKSGHAEKSYGVEVARMSGLPDAVISHAKSLLKSCFRRSDE